MPADSPSARIDARRAALAVVAVVALTVILLLSMGRIPICTCGYVKLWESEVFSSGNSQHITDWYTPSHVIHGFIFFGILWLVGRHWPIWLRLAIATVAEAGWEILENSPIIIERYREQTISLDYFGDSILNSVCDILAMVLGFWLAGRLPVWLTVTLAIAMELFVGAMIRDNLTLNIIMLLWPSKAIKAWQSGG